MEDKNWAVTRKMIYVIAFITAGLPLACGYVMEGGDILIWLTRIEEVAEGLKAGQVRMFPSAEVTVAYRGQFSALNSNLWLFFPAIMRLIGISVTTAYRIYLLFLNGLGFFAARRMFGNLFRDKTAIAVGVLLYMTCPYRIYLYYDKAALGMAAAWALIPFVLGEIILLYQKKLTWQRVLGIATAYALIGYADGILMFLVAGVVVLYSLWQKKWMGLLPILVGEYLFLPGAIYWLRYLLKDGMEAWELPLDSIVSRGYSLGQFFSGWTYTPGRPGLGLGIMGALILLIWGSFTEKDCALGKKYGFYVFLLGLMSFLSMNSFFWDTVQRLGAPFLRLVALMETPGILFGIASMAAAVLGVHGMFYVQKKNSFFARVGIPLIIVTAAVGNAVYICNMLTYTRVPMFL